MNVQIAGEIIQRLQTRLRAAIVGRDEVIDLLIVALLSDGHVLLEDYPGSGKTTLAKALGQSIVSDETHLEPMRRVQFTPDLLPSDVTGTTIFDPDARTFEFRPGPVFTHILLADEINRTSPKVQSALLEAMGEKQCTIDNTTHSLSELFFVIATQNPLDLAGTFPLPTAQLDRFLFKIRMTHISTRDELDLLVNFAEIKRGASIDTPKVTVQELLTLRTWIAETIKLDNAIKHCLVEFADQTRRHPLALQGVSTRSLVLAMPALQTWALVQGRQYVAPTDVEALAPHIFAHRLMMGAAADSAMDVVSECLKEPMETCARKVYR
jgi:MoxR-like ATPase